MRPDLHRAMLQAVRFGPGHCPPDLFAGSAEATIAGLQAYSGNVWQARHAALNATFPRTRSLIGAERFDRIAADYLDRTGVRALPPDRVGLHFPPLLDGEARFLAQVEWAWLQSHGAADAPALRLGDLAWRAPAEVVALQVQAHPAALAVQADGKPPLEWDSMRIETGCVLVTRPQSEVVLAEAPAGVAALLDRSRNGEALGHLLEQDADATALLLSQGALRLPGKAS